MDPKISKKTQDTLGKIIKKPPLTDKLLSKPPFRFLHDVMTSVIKTTGVMKGLYTDSELNSENVKDKESKMAFLQKAVDFTCAATGKNLGVKTAKVVAGHEPEKTNEFLQQLAAACSSKVDSDEIIDKMNNKSGSSKKEEKKEERSKDRERSGDRRKRDDDKKSRERSHDEGKGKEKEDRHREKEDRHRGEKEDRHKDRDREREQRHKSGRSRTRPERGRSPGKKVPETKSRPPSSGSAAKRIYETKTQPLRPESRGKSASRVRPESRGRPDSRGQAASRVRPESRGRPDSRGQSASRGRSKSRGRPASVSRARSAKKGPEKKAQPESSSRSSKRGRERQTQPESSGRSSKRGSEKQSNEKEPINQTSKGVSMKQTASTCDVDSDIFLSDSDGENNAPPRAAPMDATFAVPNPTQMGPDPDRPDPPMKLIPRQVSTYREMKPIDRMEEEAAFSPEDSRVRNKRPKGARPRRENRADPDAAYTSPATDPPTPYVSEDDNIREEGVGVGTGAGQTMARRGSDVPKDNSKVKGDGRTGVAANKVPGTREPPAPKSADRSARAPPQKTEAKRGPIQTSTPKNSPESPRRGSKAGQVGPVLDKAQSKSAKYGVPPAKGTAGKVNPAGKKTERKPVEGESKRRTSIDVPTGIPKEKKDLSFGKNKRQVEKEMEIESYVEDTSGVNETEDKENRQEKVRKQHRRKRRSKEQDEQTEESESDHVRKSKDKVRYRNDDYEHEKVKKSKKCKNKYMGMHADEQLYSEERGVTDTPTTDSYSDETLAKRRVKGKRRIQREKDKNEDEAYYTRKKPTGLGDRRKRSSFVTMLNSSDSERREDDGKENDAPRKDMVNGDTDHKPADAPVKMQRPSSAKGSRRRMEGGLDSSDEDVPVQRNEPTLGEDDLPPQVAGRMARPSSARPAPPKRKEDVVHNEPAMRLGSGKPQNLIIDDGKDSDEDETFVVEESAPPPVEPDTRVGAGEEQEEDEDEDHGGLVKKIMETKKEYEQTRKTDIERPTISDAQRRKQREAVQREIDKLRGSIQTLTRSANPLGKIMDYVQEDLDSMQKELEKWKAENKEHGLALKREKAITDRAVEPLKVQLSEVDQQIKDQLELIGAVKSNIIRNDSKMEKMLRTIAKS